MKRAESSPIRVSRHQGLVFFEMVGYKLEDEDFHRSGISVYHRDYKTAKKMFWAEWKEMHPDYFLDARLSS